MKSKLEGSRLPTMIPILRYGNSALSSSAFTGASVKLLPSSWDLISHSHYFQLQNSFTFYFLVFSKTILKHWQKAVPLKCSSQNKQCCDCDWVKRGNVISMLINCLTGIPLLILTNQSLFKNWLKLEKFKFITQVIFPACRNWWHLYVEDCFTQVLKIS